MSMYFNEVLYEVIEYGSRKISSLYCNLQCSYLEIVNFSRRIADAFLTVNAENCDTYKLNQLVSQFNLSDRIFD
jgi:hypothetical protein